MTTTPDFRALCAELADELDAETGYTKKDGERITHTAVASARTALATPPPEPPTDEDLQKLLFYEFTTSTGHGERVDEIGFARAALERWGHAYPTR